MALFQWKQDIGAAERCCNEALRIDSSCEAAVATLAQLNLQQSKIEKAVEMFSRQAELARSEPELVNALTYQFVSFFSLFFGVVLGSTSFYILVFRTDLMLPNVVRETHELFFFQATSAQVEFLRNYPAMAAQLSQMAQSMMG